MDKNTGHNRRLMITKNSILMLVMLVIIFLAIWAWYANANTVTASMTTISAADSENIELALPEKVNGEDSFPVNNSSWKNTIEFTDTGYLKNLFKDITSDGEQFAIPNFEAAAGLEQGRKVIPDDVWESGLSSKEALTDDKPNNDDQYNYISLDFYARSKSKKFSVKGSSYLAAGSELGYDVDSNGNLVQDDSNIKLLKGSDILRQSSYGAAEDTDNAFSADAIVGAMRVSLTGAPVDSVTASGGKSTPNLKAAESKRFVWLPRPDLYLKTDDLSANWELFTGITPANATYADKTYCHTFYKGRYVAPDKKYVNVADDGKYYYVDNGSEYTGNRENLVKKSLEKKVYYDSEVKGGYSGDNVSNPNYFKVSKIGADDPIGSSGYYPTLNQNQTIAGDATVNNYIFTKDDNTDERDLTGYYVYKYTLNLWIEGEDAEARRSMDNGLFSLYLEFGT